MAIESGIKNYKKLKTELDKLKKAPQTVLNRTLKDAKKRVPGWVSAEVAKVYGISKKEVGDGKTSTLKIKGDSVSELTLEYKGRQLTHTHFKMSPTTPPGGAYTLKATIVKGNRSKLGKVKKLTKKQLKNTAKNYRRQGTRNSDHSPIMLMPTGNRQEGGTNYIPFQRKSKDREDIHPIKSLSVPQMIDNTKVRPNIQKAIDTNLGKRLEHHMKLLNK